MRLGCLELSALLAFAMLGPTLADPAVPSSSGRRGWPDFVAASISRLRFPYIWSGSFMACDEPDSQKIRGYITTESRVFMKFYAPYRDRRDYLIGPLNINFDLCFGACMAEKQVFFPEIAPGSDGSRLRAWFVPVYSIGRNIENPSIWACARPDRL